MATAAFTTPIPTCPTSTSLLSLSSSTLENRCMTQRTSFAIARRRSRVSTITITACEKPGFSEGADSDSRGDGVKDDSTASDLALPDLRALFEPAGDPDCEQCEGAGEISCMICGGTGVFSMTMMDSVSTTVCRMCKGKKTMPCPSCRKEVYKSVVWWDLIPSKDEDPDENWREGPDGEPRVRWNDNPATGGR